MSPTFGEIRKGGDILDKLAFGQKIRERRQAKGLTLRQLSLESGVSPSYIGRIEIGERFPSGHILMMLAKPLGFGEVELLKLAGILAPDASDQKLETFKREVKREIAHALVAIYKKVDSF